MSRPHDEDLFEETKMTFGEHLDELRSALLKALVALIVGFLVGLLYGGQVVQVLEIPIKGALQNYYAESSAERMLADVRASIKKGQPVPQPLQAVAQLPDDKATARIKEFLTEQRMLPEEAYIQPHEIVQQLKQKYPDAFAGVELPSPNTAEGAFGKEDMIRILLWRPADVDHRLMVRSLSAQEPFFIYIKAALVFGAVIASPFIFWSIWSFVAAGLYPHEKHYVYLFGPVSLVLFIFGAALAFFVVFRFVLAFLFQFNAYLGIDPDPRISEWLSFALLLPLGFGISFQLPLVMLFLERIGVFTVDSYLEKWRIAVLVISILSMLLTPADPMSMILLALPLTALYFAGIAFCYFWPRKRSLFAEPIE